MNILSSVAVSSWIWWMAILLSQSQEVCQQYLKSEWLAGGLMLLKLGLLEGLSLQYENWQNHTPIKCCSIFTSYYREKVGASGTRVPKREIRPRIESIQLSLSLWIRTKVNITFLWLYARSRGAAGIDHKMAKGGRGSIGQGIDDVQLWQVTEKAGPIYQSSSVWRDLVMSCWRGVGMLWML